MNVTNEQLARVTRVDTTPETAPKLGMDRPYSGDYVYSGDDDNLRLMATTPGGMEELSAKEFAVTFPTSDIKLRNGKLHFTASVDEFPRVHGLRSIDNLYCTIADVKFKWDIIPEGVPAHTPPLRRIAEDINWPSVAQLWSRNQPFVRRGNKKTWNKKSTVNGESTNKGRSFRSRTFGVFQHENDQCGDPSEIRYRATGRRIGKKQKIASDKCASIFGAAVNDFSEWPFDLTDHNLHLHVHMMGDSIQILLQLTNDSLHRRNITHHGITTLRPTICHGLLRESNLMPGDIILDPMAGCGSIPIEGAIASNNEAYFIGSDIWAPAVRRQVQNVDHLNRVAKEVDDGVSTLMIDTTQFDCTNLPLRDGSIDIVVTDLPFGKRISEGMLGVDNRTLYAETLRELARVVRRRCVLQSQDARSMVHALNQVKSWKPARSPRVVNCGGIRVSVWCLERVKN